jgi:hypothetical protein
MNALLAVNTFFFLFLAIIWGKDDMWNILLKFLFAALFLANGLQLMVNMGYIVKS